MHAPCSECMTGTDCLCKFMGGAEARVLNFEMHGNMPAFFSIFHVYEPLNVKGRLKAQTHFYNTRLTKSGFLINLDKTYSEKRDFHRRAHIAAK